LLSDFPGLHLSLFRIQSDFARRPQRIDCLGWTKEERCGRAFGPEAVAGKKQIARSGREWRLGIRAQHFAAHAVQHQANGYFFLVRGKCASGNQEREKETEPRP
jgi:hypothetical protein